MITDQMDAINVYQVFDGLWTSGQLSEADVRRLAEMGMDIVINLALPSSPKAWAGEAELVTGLGMAYYHLPVVWEAPRGEQFFQFAGVLQSFSGKKIWVHCAMNMRVSAFIYLYRRLILKENEEQACFPMREIWSPNDVWQDFIQKVIAQAGG